MTVLKGVGKPGAENGEMAYELEVDLVNGKYVATETVWDDDDVQSRTKRAATDEEVGAYEAAVAVPVAADPVLVAAEAIQAEITDRLRPSGVNSIAEVKTAIIDGLAAAVGSLSS